MTSSPSREPTAEEQARSWGIDMNLIEANLMRTFTERLEVLQSTLDTIEALRKAWADEQRQRHSATSPGSQD